MNPPSQLFSGAHLMGSFPNAIVHDVLRTSLGHQSKTCHNKAMFTCALSHWLLWTPARVLQHVPPIVTSSPSMMITDQCNLFRVTLSHAPRHSGQRVHDSCLNGCSLYKSVSVSAFRTALSCSCRTDAVGSRKTLQAVQQDEITYRICAVHSQDQGVRDVVTIQAFKSHSRSRSSCLVCVDPPHRKNIALWSVTR